MRRSRLPLPTTRMDALIQIHLIMLEADQLRDAQAGRVQHFQHGAIAMPQGLRGRGRFQQRIHLGFGQRFRQ